MIIKGQITRIDKKTFNSTKGEKVTVNELHVYNNYAYEYEDSYIVTCYGEINVNEGDYVKILANCKIKQMGNKDSFINSITAKAKNITVVKNE